METITKFLYGNHELTFDEKGRLTIPIEVREVLDPERDGNAFFVVDGVNLRLWLWPDKIYSAMVSRRSSEMAPGVEKLEFEHWNFGSASHQTLDKQNRIRIPDRMVKDAGLNKEVYLVGIRDHLELWNRGDWDAYSKDLRNRRPEIALRAKQAEIEQKI